MEGARVLHARTQLFFDHVSPCFANNFLHSRFREAGGVLGKLRVPPICRTNPFIELCKSMVPGMHQIVGENSYAWRYTHTRNCWHASSCRVQSVHLGSRLPVYATCKLSRLGCHGRRKSDKGSLQVDGFLYRTEWNASPLMVSMHSESN